MKLKTIQLGMGALLTGASLVGQTQSIPLKPESLDNCTESQRKYALSRSIFEADANGRVFVEAETQGGFEGNQNYRRDADASGGAGIVNLVGRYQVRIAKEGAYELWGRLKAPWAGTWTCSYSFQPTGAGGEAKPKADVPDGFYSSDGFGGQDPGQASASGVFDVAENQVGKHAYVQGGEVRLAAGNYTFEIQVPGTIAMDQLILSPAKTVKPEQAFADQDGKPVPGRPVMALQGSITFQKLLPMDFVRFGCLRVEAAGFSGAGPWQYRRPDRKGKLAEWVEAPADLDFSKLELAGNATDAIQFKAVLKADSNKNSPVLTDPRMEYQADPSQILTLETACGRMQVSRLNGYWGSIQKMPGKVVIRPEASAGLPFYLGVRPKDGRSVADLPSAEFHATTVELSRRDKGWELKAAYANRQEDITVRLTGVGSAGGEAVTWTVRIENRSSLFVEAFHFPVLTDVQVGPDARDDGIAWLGYLRKPMTTLEGWRRSDPGPLTFFDLYDATAAFYVGVHDPTMLDGVFHLRPYEGEGPFNYRVEKRPCIQPGASWDSAEYVLAPHEGDWHEAADRFYRPWYQKHMPVPDNPAWLERDFTGFVQYLNLCYNQLRLTDIYRMGRFFGGQFVKAFVAEPPGPDFLPEYGGLASTRRNARWVNEHSGQVDSYTDIFGPCLWVNRDFGLWQSRYAAACGDFPLPRLDWMLDQRALPLKAVDQPRQVKAVPDSNYWPRPPWNYHYCLNSKAVQEHWRRVAELFAGAGMNLYWDESGNTQLTECYSPLHTHVNPGAGWSTLGKVQCAREMIKAARRLKPDFVMTGENYNDRVMSVVNLPYHQDNGQVPFWDEVIRYTHPNQIYNAVIVRMPQLVDRAFLFHARISSCNIFGGPGFTTWLRARVLLSQALRVSYAGRYLDNVGLTVEGRGADARYVQLTEPGRSLIAIHVVNPNQEKGRLVLKPADFPPVKSAFVYTMEGKIRAQPFQSSAAGIAMDLPTESLAAILLCGKEAADQGLRVAAQMPFLEPGPPKIRLALANLLGDRVSGTVRLDQHPDLVPAEHRQIKFSLSGGEASVIEIPITKRDQLQDFVDLPLTVQSNRGKKTLAVIVPPTVANGDFELDVADNAQADYWNNGVRDFAEPSAGRYCLAIPPEISRDNVKCPFFAPETMVYLRPETKYTLRFKYRYAGDTAVHAVVNMFKYANNQLADSKRVVVNGDKFFKWKEAELEFKTPAECYKSYLVFVNGDKTGKGVNAWIDEVRIEEQP